VFLLKADQLVPTKQKKNPGCKCVYFFKMMTSSTRKPWSLLAAMAAVIFVTLLGASVADAAVPNLYCAGNTGNRDNRILATASSSCSAVVSVLNSIDGISDVECPNIYANVPADLVFGSSSKCTAAANKLNGFSGISGMYCYSDRDDLDRFDRSSYYLESNSCSSDTYMNKLNTILENFASCPTFKCGPIYRATVENKIYTLFQVSGTGENEGIFGEEGGECQDTPGFRNTPGTADCAGYVASGWCANGAAVAGQEWTLGAEWLFPERHCCACGGGFKLKDDSVSGATKAAVELKVKHTCSGGNFNFDDCACSAVASGCRSAVASPDLSGPEASGSGCESCGSEAAGAGTIAAGAGIIVAGIFAML